MGKKKKKIKPFTFEPIDLLLEFLDSFLSKFSAGFGLL